MIFIFAVHFVEHISGEHVSAISIKEQVALVKGDVFRVSEAIANAVPTFKGRYAGVPITHHTVRAEATRHT